MGQYFMPILGDSHGLNCKVFDRSVEGEYMLAKLMEHSFTRQKVVCAGLVIIPTTTILTSKIIQLFTRRFMVRFGATE